MSNWKNGAHCGNVGGDYCAYGNDYVSGEIREGQQKTYYAYCAIENDFIDLLF